MPPDTSPGTRGPDCTRREISIVFDGECTACDIWVALLERTDRHRTFDFIPAQSPRGGALLDAAGIARETLDTILVIEAGRHYVRSDAILHAMARLGGGWRVVAVLRVIPRPVRDLAYRSFARMRYRLFGRTNLCRLPGPTP